MFRNPTARGNPASSRRCAAIDLQIGASHKSSLWTYKKGNEPRYFLACSEAIQGNRRSRLIGRWPERGAQQVRIHTSGLNVVDCYPTGSKIASEAAR